MTDRPLPLIKMNGLGNQITVLDLRGSDADISGEGARAINALPGYAFDQLMVLREPRTAGTDVSVTIFNADGSEAGACGNGTRCVAHLLCSELKKDVLQLETIAGILEAVKTGPLSYSVDMGEPRLRWDEIPLSEPFHDTRKIELQVGPIDKPILHSPSVVNMGNPHCTFWVEDVDAIDLERIGPMLENHPLFPERANISLAEVTSPSSIKVRVWERGVGLTRACGSGACAAAVSAVRKRLCDREPVTVTLPGGDLFVLWRDDNHVIMAGPVELEHRGTVDRSVLAG